MSLNFGVSRQRAERDMRVRHLDAAQLFEVPDVDVVLVRQLAGFKQDHQISAAGERFPLAVVSCEHVKCFVQCGR